MPALGWFGVACLTSAVRAAVIPANDLPSRHVETQAHRGGLGLRPESTLWAFAYAMEIGADVLEMDMVFTKDEIPVIWYV
jgi:glycerophosphoryl diester phosphodiesterase